MIGDKIKSLRLSVGLTQTGFAKRLFVTPGAVSQWEKGATRPDTERLMAIAKEFSVPLDYFSDESEIRIIPGAIAINKNAVPVVGTIACGTPILAEQNIDGYVDLPEGVAADFALRCRGDSMAPTLLDGDIALIHAQSSAYDRQIVAVLADGEATLKRIYRQGDHVLLVADNPNYPPIVINGEAFIQGVVVGYTRLFERGRMNNVYEGT